MNVKLVDFEKIKLVIWDLDETFWNGTISEENIQIPDLNIKLIKKLTDIGIVNSICSKNSWETVEKVLKEKELLEYFVFPSVDWNPKGSRVKKLINDMNLRNTNVLFLDDNHLNREEVKYYCPDIMVDTPDVIPYLYEKACSSTKKDENHARLKQYEVLEEKVKDKQNYTSNEEFLFESNVQVKISNDCINHIDRIHDLLMRSNQLNFTKLRSPKEELIALINNSDVNTGYVSVSDKFGEYGIVGFYAEKNNELIHFVFSCRALGMGVEQYVYNFLNRPKLEIQGEVISDLSSKELPKWINQNDTKSKSEKMVIKNLKEHSVLIKGPCDLFQIYPYIAHTELIDTEFTYVTDSGLTIESTGHTTHIVEADRLTESQKQLVLSEVPFTDKGMYNDNIFKNNYKVVFISILQDANLGVYRRKETGERFAFLEYIHPITDPENWDRLISGEYVHAGFIFTKEILEEFSKKYEFVGRNTPNQIIDNIKYIRNKLPSDSVLVIMLGGEIYYEKNQFEAYKDRHLVHKEINDVIRKYCDENDGVLVLDVNKYLVDQSSFYDHFNHYIKPVYYKLAEEVVDIVNRYTGSNMKEKSKIKMYQVQLKEVLAPYYYKLRKLIRR